MQQLVVSERPCGLTTDGVRPEVEVDGNAGFCQFRLRRNDSGDASPEVVVLLNNAVLGADFSTSLFSV